MDSNVQNVFSPSEVAHPGETVVEYLEFNGWSQRDLARRTGLTPKTISEVCNGKAPITPSTSIALEKAFNRPAHLWLNLQRQFDEAEARQRVQVSAVKWKEWAAKFPVAEMKKLQWLEQSNSRIADTDALLTFLGVSSPHSWNSVWQANRLAYRQTRKFETSVEAISAWVRRTELEATELRVARYDEQRLRSLLQDLRRLTMRRAETIMEPVRSLCASAGVAVVWVPELPHMGISGCARWLTESKALIGLTLRYKTDDQMWFTFFHEVAHILLHRKTHSFVIDNAAVQLSDKVVDPEMQKYEDEANRFSADTLIPPQDLAVFISSSDFGNDAIKNFAEKIGVSPGLVVGRLQFEGLLKPFQGNALKQRLSWRMSE